jgi:hypothetical protein
VEVNSKQHDILTDIGIIVISESERALILDLMEESIDRRSAKSNSRTIESLRIYNKMAIGIRSDSTPEHEFGILKQQKEAANAANNEKKSRRRSRRRKDS